MSHSHSHLEEAPHRFPVLRFTLTTVVQLSLAIGVFRWIAPDVFAAEMSHPLGIFLGALLFGIPLSLFEYFYHRYLLHSAVLPFLSRMHRAHGEHHGLTYVKAPVRPNEPERFVEVRSEYPVEHAHQEESMMFPDYALSIFYAIFVVVLGMTAKAIWPQTPAISACILSVTLYYCSYEAWHAVLHLPFERYWRPALNSPRIGKITRYVYGFHLMHHWRPTANVAVVGLWGVALWDHLFRTHRRPTHMPLNGAEVNYNDATLMRPVWPISALDRMQPGMYKWSRSVERWTIRLFTRRQA